MVARGMNGSKLHIPKPGPDRIIFAGRTFTEYRRPNGRTYTERHPPLHTTRQERRASRFRRRAA
jgi:hypothetical protein